jgi:hypothetical protein
MCELSVYMHGGGEAKRRYYMAMVTGMAVPLTVKRRLMEQKPIPRYRILQEQPLVRVGK